MLRDFELAFLRLLKVFDSRRDGWPEAEVFFFNFSLLLFHSLENGRIEESLSFTVFGQRALLEEGRGGELARDGSEGQWRGVLGELDLRKAEHGHNVALLAALH